MIGENFLLVDPKAVEFRILQPLRLFISDLIPGLLSLFVIERIESLPSLSSECSYMCYRVTSLNRAEYCVVVIIASFFFGPLLVINLSLLLQSSENEIVTL